MTMRPLLPWIVGTAGVLASTAQAASGGVYDFSANATTVTAGATVDFSVSFSLGTTSWASGGSNPVEPAPQEGYQEWYVNWYSWEYETLRNVWLQAGSAGFNDFPSLGAGESYGNSWSFSLTFADPGSYTIDLSGGWQSDVQYGYSNESASRTCYYVDPEVGGDLYCDSWSWYYSDADDWYSAQGSMGGGSITINVLAVPEPGTWALMLAGSGLMAAVVRRRRRADEARPTC